MTFIVDHPVVDYHLLIKKWGLNSGLSYSGLIWSNYSDLTRPGPPKGSVLEGKSPYFREI